MRNDIPSQKKNSDDTNMANLIVAILIIVLLGFWIYKLVTYDWNNFEEDSKGDDFLKPYD